MVHSDNPRKKVHSRYLLLTRLDSACCTDYGFLTWPAGGGQWLQGEPMRLSWGWFGEKSLRWGTNLAFTWAWHTPSMLGGGMRSVLTLNPHSAGHQTFYSSLPGSILACLRQNQCSLFYRGSEWPVEICPLAQSKHGWEPYSIWHRLHSFCGPWTMQSRMWDNWQLLVCCAETLTFKLRNKRVVC